MNKLVYVGVLACAVLPLAACSSNKVEQPKVVFEVNTIGPTNITYTADGINNVTVGEIDGNWSVTLPDSVYASVTIETRAGALAECHTYRQFTETDFKVIGENSWEQCNNR